MKNRLVFDFLAHLAREPKLVQELRTSGKPDVLARADELGYDFTEEDFDETVWGVEGFLAEKLGEPFDPTFSLFQTMWGKSYLDYLVDDLSKTLSDMDIDQFMTQGRPT